MKKFCFLIIAALSVTAIFAGCSDDDKKTSQSISSSAADETEALTEPATEEATQITIRDDIEKAEGTYVYDNAKLLSEAEFNECNDYAEWLYETFLINAAVITTDNINELTPEQYAQEAYTELYSGRGSGLLLLINNDTNEDYLYKTGSCLASITEEAQGNEFYRATQDIVRDDYKSAILRLMKLGEACPQHVFDNGGIFTAEDISALEEACSGGTNDVSVLATSNSTGSTNEEICRSYYDRHYQGKKGFMIMLDTASDTITVVSDEALPPDLSEAIASADTLAASKDYKTAVKNMIDTLKG